MKTTHTTLTRAARIEAVLAADNEITTEQAREYLTHLINCFGEGETFSDKLEDFAANEYLDSSFGINVIEDADVDQFLVYGVIQFDCESNSSWCGIDTILEIIEDGEATPDWWDDEWTAVEPEGHWAGYTTKAKVAYAIEHKNDKCSDNYDEDYDD